jgi:N-acetylmuramic acid 6-phosphate etherase
MRIPVSPSTKTKAFLEISSQFKLGHLVTESFHHKTTNLSQLAFLDLKLALNVLQEVDREALDLLKNKNTDLWKLAHDIHETLSSGHKVFMCGCGATGRLSLVLETLYRQKYPDNHQVFSFMAGGDYALIKSVESFEDKTEYGERQLMEMGFGAQDLLLASTEGGETPFVIGAVNKASQVSNRRPYFLYCNPDDLLFSIERSKNVLDQETINKVNLTVGPMAISGSTRMQASTVLMLGIGVGLLNKFKDQSDFDQFYKDFLRKLTQTDYTLFSPFTELESRLYKESQYLNYVADQNLAISILTDTTERSPTFSLRGFENDLDENSLNALSYLFVSGAESSADAWSRLLSRSPRPLEWIELENKINLNRVLGFDISEAGLKKRSKKLPTTEFRITQNGDKVTFNCSTEELSFNWGQDSLFNHLMLKMLLNAHSTLIMGILGRYEGNVMTWVRPSNNKLIDRAARYVIQVLKQKNKHPSYEEVVLGIFEEIEQLDENGPVVMKVVDKF